MSSTVIQSLRERRGSVDVGIHQTPELLEKWRLETGYIRLWIIGPGGDAMHPASGPYYTGTIGTDEERQIAQRAVRILDLTQRTRDAGPQEIQAALDQAAEQIRTGAPMPKLHNPLDSIQPRQARPLILATDADVRRVKAAVELVTGIKAGVFMDKSGYYNSRGDVTRARMMAIGATAHLWPDTPRRQIDDLFDLSAGTTGRAIIKSDGFKHESLYAARFASVITKLS